MAVRRWGKRDGKYHNIKNVEDKKGYYCKSIICNGMTSIKPELEVDDIVDEYLNIPICKLLKWKTTIKLEECLFEEVMKLNYHLLHTDKYLLVMEKFDNFHQNLSNITQVFKTLQMIITKQRVNNSGSQFEIDG